MKNKENNFVSAVLYVHNSEKHIGRFIEKVKNILSDHFKRYEIICVDDCSNDHSAAVIRQTAEKIREGSVVLMTTGFRQGLESSMLAGVDFASGDFVFEFDSTNDDWPMDLMMDVYQRCISGSDIVGAVPDGKPRASSQLFYKVFNQYSRTQYKVQTESFRILSRRAINRVNQMNTTIPYRKAIYANCGLKYDYIVYEPSGANGSRVLEKSPYRSELAFDSFIIFTNAAYRVSLLFTVFMMSLTAITAVYTVIIFIKGVPVAGWTTTMLLLSAGFFGLFGILSIVIKYLSVIISLIFKKVRYIVGNIEKL